jgi:hypothetical protein
MVDRTRLPTYARVPGKKVITITWTSRSRVPSDLSTLNKARNLVRIERSRTTGAPHRSSSGIH